MQEQKANILVVDDDAGLRELLLETLEAIGYRVSSVADGIEALQILKEQKIDLVITDIKMPGMDGIALLKKIRRYYPKLPVLFITGVATPEVIGRALPDGFLAKPFRIAHLEELIEDALSTKTEKVAWSIRRVMVVDDDDLFREMLADALRYDDFIPYAVSSGQEALQELERGVVDAVIADIKMPGMDGVTLLKKIKQRWPELPVILITAFFSEDEVAAKDGFTEADGFLCKPFKPENIISLLKQLNPNPTQSS